VFVLAAPVTLADGPAPLRNPALLALPVLVSPLAMSYWI